MPYAPTTWVEGVTKLGPTRMNAIEQGIAAAIPKDLGTTKGDILAYTAASTPARRAVGADGRVLKADSGQADGLNWLDLSSVAVMLATFDAKGDIIAGTADNTASRLAVGVPGQILVPDAAQATGLKWADGGDFKIFDSTLGAAAATIDITSIPTDYEYLRLAGYVRGDTAAASTTMAVRFNGDAGANYDRQRNTGAAAAATIAEQFGQTSAIAVDVMPANTATANVFGFFEILIPHYANSTNNKVAYCQLATKIGVATTNLSVGHVGIFWRSNAAINQITLLPGAGNFQIASRVMLWGIG